MNKIFRKTAAALLAVALVGGAVPAGFGGYPLNDTAVTASAAEAKTIAVGDVFNIGDSIDFGDGCWFVYNTKGEKVRQTGVQELRYDVYGYLLSGDNSGYFHQFIIGTKLMLPSENPAQPTGIRVVSGDGTEQFPFVFELVYDETQMSTIAVGDVFRLGDEIDFGGGYWFDWDSDVFGEGNAVGSGIHELIYSGYHTDPEASSGFHSFEIGKNLLIPSENTGTPVGIKVVKGSGTASDPFVFDVTYETSYSFSTASLTLKDEIGLNFFVSGVDASDWEEFTVKFSGKCAEAGKTVHLGTKNGRFCATAHLTANNMGAEIRAELYKGEEKVHELTYSAYTYLKALEATNDMAAATLLYGLAAEDYFNGTDNSAKIEELGVRLVGDEEPFNAEKVRSMCAHFGTDVTALPDDIKISAVLNDKTALRVYSEYGSRNDDYGCFDEITGILPAQLMKDRTLNIGGTEYTFSPLTWSYRALRNPRNETDPRTLNLAKALVIYGYMAAQM